MIDERYHDTHALTENKTIAPGNVFHISYTFPDAGVMRVSVEESSGQILHFCIADESNAHQFLKQHDWDGFEAEAAGEIPADAEQSTIQTYIKPGDWYVLIHNPRANRPATGRLDVEYVH
jgi:hypothetical protein